MTRAGSFPRQDAQIASRAHVVVPAVRLVGSSPPCPLRRQACMHAAIPPDGRSRRRARSLCCRPRGGGARAGGAHMPIRGQRGRAPDKVACNQARACGCDGGRGGRARLFLRPGRRARVDRAALPATSTATTTTTTYLTYILTCQAWRCLVRTKTGVRAFFSRPLAAPAACARLPSRLGRGRVGSAGVLESGRREKSKAPEPEPANPGLRFLGETALEAMRWGGARPLAA